MDWRTRAACVGSTLDAFEYANDQEWRALCASCPVAPACEQDARSHRAFGWWAGRWWSDGEPVGQRVVYSQPRQSAPKPGSMAGRLLAGEALNLPSFAHSGRLYASGRRYGFAIRASKCSDGTVTVQRVVPEAGTPSRS